MELFRYRARVGNFGDDLNEWIWDALLPGWRDISPDAVLVGVGTLINNALPRGRTKIVIGSGIGYGPLPDEDLKSECRFYSVRGPRSAAALGLPAEKGIVDPAVMLPLLPEFVEFSRSGPPVFVPHHCSVRRQDWATISQKAGVEFVSPEGDAHSIVRRLAAAPLVIAESMHAAIVADAFGTPWQGVAIARNFFPAKWTDWAESLGLGALEIPSLDPVSRGLALRMLGGRAVDGSHGSRDHAATPRAGQTHLRSIAREAMLTIERSRASSGLRQLASHAGRLSDRSRLARAQRAYAAVLAETREELGLTRGSAVLTV